MSRLTVTYNDGTLIDTTNDGSFTLATKGKLMTDDVGVAFERGDPPTLDVSVGIDANGLITASVTQIEGEEVVGTETATQQLTKRTSEDMTASGATITAPAGYYPEDASKSVATATQATPTVSVDSAGLITATATQTAGYVDAGTKTGTKQLTTKTAATITPGTSNQTIAAGTYLTGAQTIKGDANLVSEFIAEGKSIFGVTGSHPSLTLEVNVDTDSAVTVTNGSKTLTGTSENNKCTFTLPEAGTWTASAEKDGQASSSDAKTYTTSQSVTLTFAPVASISAQSGITYTDGLSGLSASELNDIAMAISNNSAITNAISEVWVSKYWRHISVGDTITCKVNSKSYTFLLMGFNHYELYSSSAYGEETVTGKAGMLFQMKTYLPTAKEMANQVYSSMSWSSSVVRSYLNTNSTGMFYKVQADIQGVIKQCKIWYNYGSQSASSSVCYDYLFIPSSTEVGSTVPAYEEQNTSVYAWYAANSGDSNRKKSEEWWLRSPVQYTTRYNSGTTYNYLYGANVYTDGSITWGIWYNDENDIQTRSKISACFCI